jgi:hypothetical protein
MQGGSELYAIFAGVGKGVSESIPSVVKGRKEMVKDECLGCKTLHVG